MSFDVKQIYLKKQSTGLNPFRAGRCLSTERQAVEQQRVMSQSLSSRAMSFDFCSEKKTEIMNKSQSLSSRAMSFDFWNEYASEDGYESQSLSIRAMSFDGVYHVNSFIIRYVSIPFEQGDVFRRSEFTVTLPYGMSQSLSIRAMSFDH